MASASPLERVDGSGGSDQRRAALHPRADRPSPRSPPRSRWRARTGRCLARSRRSSSRAPAAARADNEIAPVRALGCSCAPQRLAWGRRLRVRTAGARRRLERSVEHASLASKHRRVLHPERLSTATSPVRRGAHAPANRLPVPESASAHRSRGPGRARTEHAQRARRRGLENEHSVLAGAVWLSCRGGRTTASERPRLA